MEYIDKIVLQMEKCNTRRGKELRLLVAEFLKEESVLICSLSQLCCSLNTFYYDNKPDKATFIKIAEDYIRPNIPAWDSERLVFNLWLTTARLYS